MYSCTLYTRYSSISCTETGYAYSCNTERPHTHDYLLTHRSSTTTSSSRSRNTSNERLTRLVMVPPSLWSAPSCASQTAHSSAHHAHGIQEDVSQLQSALLRGSSALMPSQTLPRRCADVPPSSATPIGCRSTGCCRSSGRASRRAEAWRELTPHRTVSPRPLIKSNRAAGLPHTPTGRLTPTCTQSLPLSATDSRRARAPAAGRSTV